MSDIIPYLEEVNRRCASGAPTRIEPQNARKSRNRSVGRCHRAHGKPLRGIDGVKYPVGTMHGMPKEGEDLRFNYVSFRDDNVRVDHKWTDGQQRYSVTRDWDYTPSDPQREYDEVVARYTNPDGTRKPGWMRAPNGRPTNLAERQWVQVRTPAFKAWFGDWEGDPANASKVVDANGEPLVVYHDSSERHNILSRDFARKSMDIEAVFFHLKQDKYHEYGNVEHAVFLNIRNPANFAQAHEGFEYGVTDDAGVRQREKLQSEGFDGAIFDAETMGGDELAEALVFDSRQIKSATDNTGEFGTGADIRYSVKIVPVEGVKRDDAVASLNLLKGKAFTNRETGIEARLSSTGAGKLVSNKAVAKSVANGFTPAQHNALAAQIDRLYEGAILVEERPDRGGDINIRSIRRFLHPVRIGAAEAGAYITVKESVEHGNRIYSVEGIRIAALPPTVRRAIADHNSADSAAYADTIPYLAPSAQAPTPDAFVRDAVMGMLAAAGDGNGAEGADAKPTERASVRRGGSPVRIDDLAVGTLAQRILAGKDPTVDDARKFLDGFGLSRTLDAGAALRAAREIAEANRERLKGEVERANPEVIGTLARENLSREMRSAMDSLVTGAARAVDPEVGMRLKDAVAARDRRALMAAKGFTAAEEARRRDDSERRMAERRDGEDADGGDYIWRLYIR